MKLKTKIILGTIAAIVAVLVPAMTIAGWYPDRPLKKWEGPNTPGFDHVTFNSFYNVPEGNEQQFFDGKKWNTTPGGFQDPISVKPGDEIKLRTYVHNNADGSLNDAAHQYRGIARDTKVKISLPNGVGTKMNAVSQISASNAQPGSVFDTTEFVSADGTPYKLSYVAGSAYADTHSRTAMPLSDSIVTTGALIGENAPDGNVPGCFQYDMYVIVKVKVEAVPLQIQKTVGFPKQTFVEQVNAKPNDRLYFKIDFKNAGSSMLDGVVISDKLPEKLQLIPGTVKLYNANFPNGTVLPDNALFTKGGQGVGDYGAGINGYILYQVTLKDGAESTLTNVACVRSKDIPYDTCDDAKVVPPPKTPPQECLPGIPVGDSRCTPIPPTTPPTTTTSETSNLPETGVETGLVGLLGMTGLSASAHAYRKSKKDLKSAMLLKGKK